MLGDLHDHHFFPLIELLRKLLGLVLFLLTRTM
jgi:hypothetical protein